jgi:hypothetical protein
MISVFPVHENKIYQIIFTTTKDKVHHKKINIKYILKDFTSKFNVFACTVHIIALR